MTARTASELRLFAVTAPGLQEIAAGELRSLGVGVTRVEPEGVSFGGTLADLYRANLWLRTVSRVMMRVGEFRASRFSELEKQARRQPWERFVKPGEQVNVRVTCRKSRLYHSDAVAERVSAAIAFRVGGDVEPGHDAAPGQLVIVRLFRDVCTVSIDSSGELLHRRGYRLAGTRAPLRETLAAGALLASGWPGNVPLLDPLCGSGTIPIEAALIARNIAPGARRHFGFMRWPGFDDRLWASLLADAAARELPAAPAPIQGSDRDAGAIEAAQANAERAGVAADIELERRAVSAISPPAEPGWLVTNPPYGTRLGDGDRLRDLYARLGSVARKRLEGWRVVLVSASRRLDGHTGVRFEELLRTRNGGIPVRVLRGTA